MEIKKKCTYKIRKSFSYILFEFYSISIFLSEGVSQYVIWLDLQQLILWETTIPTRYKPISSIICILWLFT